jgi:hypothetical protein
VRRSMIAMLIATATLSTRLGGQAVAIGFAGTLGSGWQIEGVDLAYVRAIHVGPVRSVLLGGRGGSFVDQGAIVGGSRGFVVAAMLGLRTGLARLADVGNETNPAPLGADLTIEVSGYAGSNSPLPQGSPWAAVSLLPGLRFGEGEGVRYSLVVGPTVFFGPVTDVHTFLGLRFELPLAHHTAHP